MAASIVSRAGLNGRELSLFAAAFVSLKSEGVTQIDWNKFTQIAGYGSVDSARVCFRPVLKKLKTFVESESSGSVGDGSWETAAKVAKSSRPPSTKRPRAATQSAPRAPGRPKKRQNVEMEAASGDTEAGPVNEDATRPVIVKQEEETNSSPIGCLSLAAAINGKDRDAQQMTRLSPAVAERAPAGAYKDNGGVADKPMAGSKTIASTSRRPVSRQANAVGSSARSAVKQEQDGPSQHLAFYAAEEVGMLPPVPGDDNEPGCKIESGMERQMEQIPQQAASSATAAETASVDEEDLDPFSDEFCSYTRYAESETQ